jgi:hypothetical protein
MPPTPAFSTPRPSRHPTTPAHPPLKKLSAKKKHAKTKDCCFFLRQAFEEKAFQLWGGKILFFQAGRAAQCCRFFPPRLYYIILKPDPKCQAGKF